MGDMRINPLPAPTWRWLQLNDRKINLPEEIAAYAPEDLKAVSGDVQALQGGMGESFTALAASVMPKPLTIAEDKELAFDFKEGSASLSRLRIERSAGEKSGVVMDFTGKGTGLVSTEIVLEKNASLQLVQIHRMEEGSMLCQDIAATLGEHARLEVVHVVLSGEDINLGLQADLQGDCSELRVDTGYHEAENCILDMNYVAEHHGKQTKSEMYVNGVLREGAKKCLRATIDFCKGCSEATGAEREDVLLLDEKVKNQTIPLILCAEENVEGAHGATIGKVPEETRFYLASRGLTDEEIYHMLSVGRLVSVVKRIDRADVRQCLLADLDEEGEFGETVGC